MGCRLHLLHVIGIAPGATGRNLAYFGADVAWGEGVTEIDQQLLGDPQTSGGLLIAVAPAHVDALVDALRGLHTLAAHPVGALSSDSGIRVHATR